MNDIENLEETLQSLNPFCGRLFWKLTELARPYLV